MRAGIFIIQLTFDTLNSREQQLSTWNDRPQDELSLGNHCNGHLHGAIFLAISFPESRRPVNNHRADHLPSGVRPASNFLQLDDTDHRRVATRGIYATSNEANRASICSGEELTLPTASPVELQRHLLAPVPKLVSILQHCLAVAESASTEPVFESLEMAVVAGVEAFDRRTTARVGA